MAYPLQWFCEDQPTEASKNRALQTYAWLKSLQSIGNLQFMRKMWTDGLYYYDFQIGPLGDRVRVWGGLEEIMAGLCFNANDGTTWVLNDLKAKNYPVVNYGQNWTDFYGRALSFTMPQWQQNMPGRVRNYEKLHRGLIIRSVFDTVPAFILHKRVLDVTTADVVLPDYIPYDAFDNTTGLYTFANIESSTAYYKGVELTGLYDLLLATYSNPTVLGAAIKQLIISSVVTDFLILVLYVADPTPREFVVSVQILKNGLVSNILERKELGTSIISTERLNELRNYAWSFKDDCTNLVNPSQNGSLGGSRSTVWAVDYSDPENWVFTSTATPAIDMLYIGPTLTEGSSATTTTSDNGTTPVYSHVLPDDTDYTMTVLGQANVHTTTITYSFSAWTTPPFPANHTATVSIPEHRKWGHYKAHNDKFIYMTYTYPAVNLAATDYQADSVDIAEYVGDVTAEVYFMDGTLLYSSIISSSELPGRVREVGEALYVENPITFTQNLDMKIFHELEIMADQAGNTLIRVPGKLLYNLEDVTTKYPNLASLVVDKNTGNLGLV